MNRRILLCCVGVLASGAILRGQGTPAVVPELAAVARETPADGAPPRFWLDADYLLWWVRRGPVPGPMVTTGPASGTPGRLGSPGTEVLFGQGSDIDYKGHSGGRFNLGLWLDTAALFGCEAEGLFLETHTDHFEINSDKAGTPVIARPFFNQLAGIQDAQVLTAPGSFFGGIDVFSDSRLWGAESNLLLNAAGGAADSVDLLVGFRYLGLDESLRISQSTMVLPGAPPTPVRPFFLGTPVPDAFILSLTDRFESRNEFFGGQLGLRGRLQAGRWLVDAVAKVGLGATKQWVNNMGVTELTGPAGSLGSVPAGLYAVGTNRGLYSRDRLTLVSEVGCRLGYQISPRWEAHFGYTFLYWGNVARPGEQMNPNINPRLVPSNPAFGAVTAAPEPLRRFASSEYWAMGLSLGLAFRY